MPVSVFLRRALRRPDGVVAYSMAAASVVIPILAWIAPTELAQLDAVSRIRANTLPLLCGPLLALACYAQLNFLSDYPARRWINAVLMVVIGVGFLWLGVAR
jgi:hypothetical protein